MNTKTLSTARNDLLQLHTGVERRLLYLAAGNDLGCSLWLFWHKCDSFYLVDPEYGASIHYDGMIESLIRGDAPHMSGVKLVVASVETGVWQGSGALPGRRYQVYAANDPNQVKRLCFVRAGSTDWLASTTSRYNVVLNKDYAGINNDADDAYPYHTVWGRLNQHGIFAETVGAARSNAARGFGKYRFRGLVPLTQVTRDTGEPLGFNTGLVLFQKQNDALPPWYASQETRLDLVETAVNAVLGIFPLASNYNSSALDDEPEYADLQLLMQKTPVKNWPVFSATPAFKQWFVSRLQAQFGPLDADLLLDVAGSLRLETWASFT